MRRHLENHRDNCAAFDTSRWVKNMESGLSSAWKRHEQNLTPDHIVIEDTDPIFYNNGGDIL
jgi:hypothetical protein